MSIPTEAEVLSKAVTAFFKFDTLKIEVKF